jgi:putative ABC transport system permease protein
MILLALGALLTYAGLSGEQVTPFNLGVSLIILATIPLLRWLGVPDRLAFTVPAIVLLVWWLLPSETFEFLLPEMGTDFNLFIVGGLILVTSVTWIVMYNADALIGPSTALFGRVRGLIPTLRTAVAYPLTNRFRTGVTLAMFTLVVFTLVVGAVTVNAFNNAFDDIDSYSGGFDIRAETAPVSPVDDLQASIDSSGVIEGSAIEAVAEQSLVGIEAWQLGTDNEFADYPLRGLDQEFFANTTYRFAAIAEGYDEPQDVWKALSETPGLAVVDGLPAPRRNALVYAGGPQTDFALEGFWLEDGIFTPFQVEVRDPVTGRSTTLTVIGVLTDIIPQFMIGLSTSQVVVDQLFPEQGEPSAHLIRLADGADAQAISATLESNFLANGMEAVVLEEELADVMAFSRTFTYIVEGF